MSTTPNMSLVLPTVGVTLGPDWAEQLNGALELVDLHDHTAGSGVPIPTAGLSIDSDLSLNNFNLIDVNSVTLSTSTAVSNNSLYMSGGELIYKDGSGNVVPITSLGGVNAGVGSITGLTAPATATFAGNSFVWAYDTSKVARMEHADLTLYPYDGVTSYTGKYVTLKASTAMSSFYTLTLPTALPANTNFMQVSNAGVISFSNTITQPVLAAAGSAASPTYSFSSDTNTGIYSSSADNISVSTGGTLRLTIGTSSLTSTLTYLGADGTAASPGLSFSADTNTGIYRSGSDAIGISTGGTVRLSISGAGVTASGALSATSLETSSGGAFKVKLISLGSTGSVGAGGTGTVSAAHGLTYANIRSVSVFARAATFAMAVSEDLKASFLAGDTANLTVYVYNSSGSSQTYTVYAMIYYE